METAKRTIGEGIIIDGILYYPIIYHTDKYEDDRTLCGYHCECDSCQYPKSSVPYYCMSWAGEKKVLQKVGRILLLDIDNSFRLRPIRNSIIIDEVLYAPSSASCQFCDYGKCPMSDLSIEHRCESFNTTSTKFCLSRIGKISKMIIEQHLMYEKEKI